jgi:acyl-CoA synthetase (AMP-forming)/AMP-acid ligase II
MTDLITLKEAFLRLRNQDYQGIWFIEGSNGERFLPYSKLYIRVRSVLARLQSQGLHAGDRVILALNDNELFITVFWACIAGGIVAVPVSFGQKTEQHHKLLHILTVTHAHTIVADTKSATQLKNLFAGNDKPATVPLVVTLTESDIDKWDNSEDRLPAIGANDLAFIQFSSGSTSSPKGVMLTHGNLLTNIRAIIRSVALTPGDTGLSWMPLTHDMGLIGFHITSLVYGISQYLMPTILFIRRPLLWLDAATRYGVTILASPNFGYKHFLDRFKQTPRERINFVLDQIRIVFNGAEPISPALTRSFIQTLQPYGLREQVMFPVYGLAEASVAVSFPVPGLGMRSLCVDRRCTAIGDSVLVRSEKQKGSVELVSVGVPIDGCSVQISDNAGKVLPDETVGRILIKGENVSTGYYNNALATAVSHTADSWLDTGDIGFFYGGELYIAGRTKDLIFVRGQNYHAHDIERISQEIPGVLLDKTVAVGFLNEMTNEHNVVLFVIP